MGFTSLIYSVIGGGIGGGIVAIINHFLTLKRMLSLQRERYREILFLEKIKAYKEVYEAAGRFIAFVNSGISVYDQSNMQEVNRLLANVSEAININSIFMPQKVINEISRIKWEEVQWKKDPVAVQVSYELENQPTDEEIKILIGRSTCNSIRYILRDDLGVEMLTSEVGKFIQKSSFKSRIKPSLKKKIKDLSKRESD